MMAVTKVICVDASEKLRLVEPEGSPISILTGANLVKPKRTSKSKSTKKRKDNKDG